MTAAIPARLTSAASSMLPTPVKRRLKRLIRAYQETLFPFTPEDLTRALRQLGVVPGDVLMVHSAFDRFVGFRGGPLDVVRTLQAVVGKDGTLLMPTTPFRRGAIEYALTDPIFDARQTVSQMGLVTEIFRRSQGVVRSNHPTHSVAAWGRHASAMIAGHEQADTPCGRLSPYARLLEHQGKILLAGVADHTMTFGYVVVEELEPRLTFPVLTREKYPLRWRDQDGTVRCSHVRLFSPQLDHDIEPLVSELKRRGQWHERRAGRLRLVLLLTRDVWNAGMALANRGTFPRERPVS
jgi:hypothetical protein